jgi:hypothetical protein
MPTMNRREACQFIAGAAASSVVNALPARGWVNQAGNWPSPEEAKQIAGEAYVYAFPIVQNYLSIYQFALDSSGSQYKGPVNEVHNVARVFTPADTGVITPNSDTPYSFLIMDLRAEPIVVTIPAVDKNRYYSLQLVDLYTNNVDYLGTRTDGNGGGNFLIAGPGWNGATPQGIKRAIHIDTLLMYAQIRTQLFDAADIDKVKQIQSGYKAQPLSAYLHQTPPKAPPKIDYPRIDSNTFDPQFWQYVNFLLQFCPTLPSERELRAKFERIGMKANAPWPPTGMPADIASAIQAAAEEAHKSLDQDAMKLTSSVGLFGTPQEMAGKYRQRALGALAGIYGNSPEEAVYPSYVTDPSGQPYDTSKFNYKGELPPVNAFWSVTMYDMKTRFLVENPLNRYLINSNMIPQLKKNPDGGVTLYLQHNSPGPKLESNWLPAPNGPMGVVLRLYLPKPEVLTGKWVAPSIQTNGSVAS